MGFLSSSIAKLLPFSSSCCRVQDDNERGKPALVLENKSSYVVSFWVLQEDKLKTTCKVTEAGTGTGGTLKIAANSYPSATVNRAKTTQSMTVQEKDPFYLMRDHRVGADGTTTVPFPNGCRELRVMGSFNRKSGKGKDKRVLGHFKKYFSRKKWKPFKDVVYSIDQGDEVFRVVVTDDDLKMYT